MRKDYNLEKRKYVISGFIVVIVLVYIARLVQLQVLDNTYKQHADNNAFMEKVIYPSRGLIYDRNGKLVVYNAPEYDLMVIPKDVVPFDTIDLCNTLKISKSEFNQRWQDMSKGRNYSAFTQQVFMNHLTPEDYGRLQEKLYRFPGFFVVQRILRQYNYNVAANVLGDIREVNARDIENDDYYRPGDYTGDLGIEKSYEAWLRGVKGKEILIRDEIDIIVSLGDGDSSAEAYGCDLTYDYVRINGDYRT